MLVKKIEKYEVRNLERAVFIYKTFSELYLELFYAKMKHKAYFLRFFSKAIRALKHAKDTIFKIYFPNF